jgi:hypothetical protein
MTADGKYVCPFCCKQYKHRQSLYKHKTMGCKCNMKTDGIKQDVNTQIHNKPHSHFNTRNYGYVYLIQPAQFLGTNIFKVGCSTLQNMSRVNNGYKRGSHIMACLTCKDPKFTESFILKIFRQKFTLFTGNEYFMGDFDDIFICFRDTFDSCVRTHEKSASKDNQTNCMMDEDKHERTDIITQLKIQIAELTNKYNTQFGHIQSPKSSILNYEDTDYSFLTDDDYLNCIRENNNCVNRFIEMVHFNLNKVENMNIYISSHKGNRIHIYRGDSWQIDNKKKGINKLYEFCEKMISKWYNQNKDNYSHDVTPFSKYLERRTNDNELLKELKDETNLLLYNNRKLIQES